MLYYALKVGISAFVIVAITEIAKRSSGFAALLAAIPLTSLLAFIWLHVEGAACAHCRTFRPNFLAGVALSGLVSAVTLADQARLGFLAESRDFRRNNHSLLFGYAARVAQVWGAVVIPESLKCPTH